MKLLTGTLAILAVLAVGGCQSNPPKMDPAIRASITKVAIVASGQLPDEMFYLGSEHAFSAALGGVVGALVAQGASTTGEKIDLQLKKHVDMPSIYRAEFIEAFTRNNPHGMEVVEPNDADAVIVLVITRYGFGKANAFASTLRPLVIGGMKLQTRSGESVWQDGASVTPLDSDIYGTDIESYFSDPSNFHKALSSAFKSIAEQLVGHMNRT